MTRRNIPISANVPDGYYDSETGEARIQLGMPVELEGTTNCAFLMDASRSMRNHYDRPFLSREPSDVETFVRAVGAAVAALDSDKGVQVYLACTEDGTQVRDLGNFTKEGLEELQIDLKQLHVNLGSGTYLLPAIKQAVQEIVVAPKAGYGFILLLTDGEISDFNDLLTWTQETSDAIAAGQHPLVKILLVGFDDANAQQLEDLDNYKTGNGIDIWNTLNAGTLANAQTLLNSEALSSKALVARFGRLEVNGTVVKEYKDGLPQRLDLTLPTGLTSVTLFVGGGSEEQSLEIALI